MKTALASTRRPRAATVSIAGAALASAAVLCLPGGAHAADPPVETVTVRAVAHFGFDQATIRPQDRNALLAEVGKMQGVTWQTVTAVGHTDAIGSSAYNRGLSARRSSAVKGYLVGKGVPSTIIEARSEAEAAPVGDNDSAQGRAKNRRTEVEFRGVRAKLP